MPWVIINEESSDAKEIRKNKDLMEAHWQYELSIKDRIIAAISMREDDTITPNGGIVVFDTETKEEALALYNADPLTQSGLRVNLTVRYWFPAILNGEALI